MFWPTLRADLPPGPEAIEVEPMLRSTHRGLSVIPLWGGQCRDSPVLDLLGHGQESLLDVGSVLSRGLEEWDIQLVGEFLIIAHIRISWSNRRTS